jgi:hypothetical protein
MCTIKSPQSVDKTSSAIVNLATPICISSLHHPSLLVSTKQNKQNKTKEKKNGIRKLVERKGDQNALILSPAQSPC